MIDLAAKGVSAVKWSTSTTAGRVALQILGQVFLARTLGPEVYGIFGMGLLVFTFSNFFATFGFGWALLQVVDLREEDVQFSFTWQLASGTTAALALFFLAPSFAAYFHNPSVQPVIRWLALACVFNAAASPPYYLLQRDMNFRASGLIDLSGYALGYIVVGIPLARAGAGIYSLIAAWLLHSFVRLVAFSALRPFPRRLLFWYDRARSMLAVGSTVFITSLGNWFLNNVDGLLIGRLLNAQALGLYNLGYNLANTPNTMLLSALQPTFFSACARMQDDLARLRRAYLQVVSAVWVLVAPVFVFLSVISPDLVRFLYGPKWNAAGGVLAVLFLAMPFYVSWGISTPVLWNTGRKHYEFLLQLPLLIMAVVAFYLFAPLGVHVAALVAAGLLASRGLAVGVVAFRAVGLRASVFLPHLLRGAVLSVVTAAGAWLGQYVASGVGMPLVSLLSAGIGALVLVVGVVAVVPTLLGDHAAVTVVRFVPKLRHFLKVSDAPALRPGAAGGNA